MENINWNTVLTAFFAVVPALSVVIALAKKFFPQTDPYFEKSAFVLGEVDDILDRIVAEFPENEYLNTANDIVEKLVKELEQAGYKVDDKQKKQLQNRAIAKLKKEEGLSMETKDGNFNIQWNKKF